jgi:hypothetical protein
MNINDGLHIRARDGYKGEIEVLVLSTGQLQCSSTFICYNLFMG